MEGVEMTCDRDQELERLRIVFKDEADRIQALLRICDVARIVIQQAGGPQYYGHTHSGVQAVPKPTLDILRHAIAEYDEAVND